MKPMFDYDVVIAGGGMVGASLALLLSHHSENRLKILIVESFSPPPKNPSNKPNFRPSFDARSSALSYGSRLILETLGLWSLLKEHSSPINSIHVSERGWLGSTLMTKEEAGWPSLGYVIENVWLGNVLLSSLSERSNIHFKAPMSVSDIKMQEKSTLINVKDDQENITQLTAQLAIVADGVNSKLRQQLGIIAKTHNYEQTALIANVSFSKPHKGRAFERFTDQGPMALLPLTDTEQGKPRAALVWSLPERDAERLSVCSDNEFLNQLQNRFGHRQGEFLKVGKRNSYSLSQVLAQEQVRTGVVVMGNAAHSLHPVAGQGFNLALRDCVCLAQQVSKNLNNDVFLGDLSSLTHYFSQQQFDQEKTSQFSDYLPTVFNHHLWGMGFVRRLGLATLDVMPMAKKYFIHHAAGMHNGAGHINSN